MFEKEAEEYLDTESKYLIEDNEGNIINIAKKVKQSFKDGAEFGYNKAFVEADKNLKAVVADFNKANKWHYVKDGDLPKENEYIMIYSKLADNMAVGKRRCAGKIRKRCVYEWYFATYEGTYCLRDKDIIAWKEIVLPKEMD